jgi:hypothetical protein
MKTWIGAAIVIGAGALAVASPIATAAPVKPTTLTAGPESATDFSARRYHRRYERHSYRPQPHYYARPYYYRPYPYSVPAPFTFGFAFAPRW